MQGSKKIVILGAGYAGLTAAKALRDIAGTSEVSVTVINKNPYHYGTTLLHEVAAGTTAPNTITFPLEPVLKELNVHFLEATVQSIDKEHRMVATTQGHVPYDILVIALGFESETFGIPGMKEYAMAIEDVQSASRIEKKIHEAFATYHERAKKEEHPFLSIIVGGAGFTGIELVGELVNRIPKLCKQYNVPRDVVKVICVESMQQIIPMFSSETVTYAKSELEKKGVVFRLSTRITGATENSFLIETDGIKEELLGHVLIWTAGVRGSSLMEKTFDDAQRGRLVVTEHLKAPNHDNIYVVGDCAAFIGVGESRPYPTTAQIASQMGDYVGHHIVKTIQGKQISPFSYNFKGALCSLGHSDGVAQMADGMTMKGFIAALAKKAVETKSIYEVANLGVAIRKNRFFV